MVVPFELRFSEVEKGQRSGILIDLLEGIALDECAKLTSNELQDRGGDLFYKFWKRAPPLCVSHARTC